MAEEHDQEQQGPPDVGADDADVAGDEDRAQPQDRKKRGAPRHPDRPARQAARYRVQRNEARRERDDARNALDELKLEHAFTRAAGSRFVDLDAAWRLVDRSILTLDFDGTPVGAEAAVQALADSNPFLLAPGLASESERDPFKPAHSSGRTMNGKRKPLLTGPTRSQLEERFPALRRR